MSYEIIKSFKTDRKNLIIKATYQVNNVRDCWGKRITEIYQKKHDSIKEFEDSLIVWANEMLSGTAKFSRSMTFSKRVHWLHLNSLTRDKHQNTNTDWEWFEMIDTPLTRKILSGEIKPKNAVL